MLAHLTHRDGPLLRNNHVLGDICRTPIEREEGKTNIDNVAERDAHLEFHLVQIDAVVGNRAQIFAAKAVHVPADDAVTRLGGRCKQLADAPPKHLLGTETVTGGPFQGLDHAACQAQPDRLRTGHGVGRREAPVPVAYRHPGISDTSQPTHPPSMVALRNGTRRGTHPDRSGALHRITQCIIEAGHHMQPGHLRLLAARLVKRAQRGRCRLEARNRIAPAGKHAGGSVVERPGLIQRPVSAQNALHHPLSREHMEHARFRHILNHRGRRCPPHIHGESAREQVAMRSTLAQENVPAQ
jgi:hypothetical protein